MNKTWFGDLSLVVALVSMFLAVVSIINGNILMAAFFFSSSGVAASCLSVWQKRNKQPVLVDGRTHDEWLDIINDMGRDEFESLVRPALDGLEESAYGWDVKKLLGDENYAVLMRGWYPERHCKYCGQMFNANGDCFWDGPCHTIAKEIADEKQRKAREAREEHERLKLEYEHIVRRAKFEEQMREAKRLGELIRNQDIKATHKWNKQNINNIKANYDELFWLGMRF